MFSIFSFVNKRHSDPPGMESLKSVRAPVCKSWHRRNQVAHLSFQKSLLANAQSCRDNIQQFLEKILPPQHSKEHKMPSPFVANIPRTTTNFKKKAKELLRNFEFSKVCLPAKEFLVLSSS